MDIAGQGYPLKYLYPGLKVVISGQFCTLLVNQYKQPIYTLILIIDYFDLHRQDFSDIEIWYGLEEREGCQQTLREIMEEGVELSDWQ